MLREERRHDRRRLDADMDGYFQVEAGNLVCPLDQVYDVSVSGTGFVLPIALPRRTCVTLSYECDSYEVKVQGVVVWCEPSSGGDADSYRIGVRFDRYDQRNSSMLFMALKRNFQA